MEKIEFPPELARDGMVETMFVEPVSQGLRLENSPFYVYGVSYGDILDGENIDNRWIFTGVAVRGGHSTYRILLRDAVQEQGFVAHSLELERLGCTYEEGGRPGRRLYAVDVPPCADVQATYALLEQGEAQGAWTFEEGHYYDSTKKTP